MQVHLDVILGWIKIIKDKRNPDDIDDALDLLGSLANMFRTTVQDLDTLLIDREEIVQLLIERSKQVEHLQEQVDIYDELERVRSQYGQA
jgi:hypothetical protein